MDMCSKNSSILLTDIVAYITLNNDSYNNFWSLFVTNNIITMLNVVFILLKYPYEIITAMGFSISSFIMFFITIYYAYKLLFKPVYYKQGLDLVTDKKEKLYIDSERRSRNMGTKVPPPYPNGWYMILDSEELKVGEIKHVNYLGENFAVNRGMDGVVSITDAYCPHLGANMGVGGKIIENCIECPFHKWRFDIKTGKCISIPNVDTVPRGMNLKVWPSAEVDGAILVWYDIEGRAPQWEIPSIEKIKNGEWIYHGKTEFFTSTIVQDVLENGADVEHFNSIHKDGCFSGKYLPTNSFYNFLSLNDWEVKWKTGHDAPHIADCNVKGKWLLFNTISIFEFEVLAQQNGPCYVTLNFKCWLGSCVFFQTVTPVEPLLVKMTNRLYAPWYIRPIAAIFIWVEGFMLYRDIQIWNKKKYVYNPQLSKEDKNIKAFRTWYNQFYSTNSISFKNAVLGSVKDLIDW